VSVPPQSGQPYGVPPMGQPVPPGARPPVPGTPVPGRPPYGPPPGQPGVFSLPPGQPYGPPPGRPAGRSKKWVVVPIVGAVLVIGLVVAGLIARTSSPDTAAVGDCLNVKEFTEGSEPAKVACTDPSANVKVAVKLDSSDAQCPDNSYDEYSVSGSGAYKLCLIPNDKDGDCLANFGSDTTKGYQRVDCADPTAEVKVVKIVAGVADQSACDGTDATLYVTYPQPKSTYCYQALKQTST